MKKEWNWDWLGKKKRSIHVEIELVAHGHHVQIHIPSLPLLPLPPLSPSCTKMLFTTVALSMNYHWDHFCFLILTSHPYVPNYIRLVMWVPCTSILFDSWYCHSRVCATNATSWLWSKRHFKVLKYVYIKMCKKTKDHHLSLIGLIKSSCSLPLSKPL